MRASTDSVGNLGRTQGSDGTRESSLSVFSDIARSSSLYALVPLGQRLAGVIMLPVYTRYLSPADYGVIELVVQTMFVVGTLLGGTYSAALGYHYFREQLPDRRKTVAGTCILGSAAIGALALALGWALSVPLAVWIFRVPAFVFYFRILFVTMLVDFLLEGLTQWLRVEGRPAILVAASLFRLALSVVCTLVLLVGYRWGVAGVFWSNLVAVSATALPLALYALRRLGLGFNVGLFWEMLRFSFPLALTGLALLFVNFGDRFFLQHYRTFAEVGLYSLAYRMGMMVSIVYGVFHTYWGAQVFQILKRADGEFVLSRVFTYVVVGLSWCALGLVCFTRPALRILATPAFESAASIVPVIVAAYLFKAIGDFFRCLFLVENRPGYDAACNWIGALICLAGYMALIPRFGVWGAGGATLIAFVLIAALAVIWIWRRRPPRLEIGRLAKAIAAVVLLFSLFSLVPAPAGLAGQIGWATLLLACYPLLLVLLGFPTRGEYFQVRAALKAFSLTGPRLRAGG